ncbi:MAG: DUF6048 family protein [Bacteroidaceae bacterium]|nr:DUF6048 family protein [Bacteroidaceae bacterium]
MSITRTFACIFLLCLSSGLCAQVAGTTTKIATGEGTLTVKGDSVERFQGVAFDHTRVPTYKEQPLFCGVSVGADLAGALMAQVAKFGQYEAQARFNFKQRYFPVVEIGVGTSNHTSDRTNQTYKVHSPYFRIGGDYNFAHNPVSGNRIYGGVRYGFSSFKYEISGPSFIDPIDGSAMPLDLQGVHSSMHWGELVAGLEGRLWRFIHLGWSVRWKFRFKQKDNAYGNPYYVPGYGDNTDGSCFGGNFCLLIDISDIKNSKKH